MQQSAQATTSAGVERDRRRDATRRHFKTSLELSTPPLTRLHRQPNDCTAGDGERLRRRTPGIVSGSLSQTAGSPARRVRQIRINEFGMRVAYMFAPMCLRCGI